MNFWKKCAVIGVGVGLVAGSMAVAGGKSFACEIDVFGRCRKPLSEPLTIVTPSSPSPSPSPTSSPKS